MLYGMLYINERL